MCAGESERQLSPNPEKPLSSEVGIRRLSITICGALRCAAEGSHRILLSRIFILFLSGMLSAPLACLQENRVC